jgi:hypothetical protein
MKDDRPMTDSILNQVSATNASGEQEHIELPLDAEGGYKSKLRSMLTNVPDKDIVFSLDTLDGKTDRSGAEEDLWNSLNEEHYQRCASASKETPTSALEIAVSRGATEDDYESMTRCETNSYHAAYDELLDRGIVYNND